MFDSNGERGRNRTYNLLIKRQCIGVCWGLVRNVFNILARRWSPPKTLVSHENRETNRETRSPARVYSWTWPNTLW